MEKKDEFVEMRVRTIDEAMKVDELIGHLTFNQVLDDEEKMDIMMLDGQNFKLLLEEVNEPHRMMLGIINPDEADLLYAAVNDPEGTDATLPYQTVHILKELGVTVEKVVVKDKVKLLHRAIVTLRKEDGSVMEMQLTLFDALVVSLIAGVPFYVNAKFLEDPRSGFTKSVPNTKALLLRLMPLKGLEREMEECTKPVIRNLESSNMAVVPDPAPTGDRIGWGSVLLGNYRFPWDRAFEISMEIRLGAFTEPHKALLGIYYK